MNLFQKKDKFLLQISADLTSGFTGGCSVNIDLDTDIGTMHALMDKMHRVLDRRRAIYEHETFADKLAVTETQLKNEADKKSELEDHIANCKVKGIHPKTVDENMLENCSTNVEHLKAEVELGREAVAKLEQRMAA